MNFRDTFIPDHFSRSDRQGLFVAVLFSIAALLVFLNINPPGRHDTKIPIARIETFSNNVRYKEFGTVSFYDANKNEALQDKDQIFTGKNSSAFVRFISSKTSLKIPSSSLIKIEMSEKGDTVEIISGIVNINIENKQTLNLKVKGENHKITPSESGSVIQAFVSEKKLHLISNKKDVKIETDKGKYKLPSNKEVTFTDSIIKEKSDFELLSPRSGERIETSAPLNIRLNKRSKYKITLSHTSDFIQPILKSTFEGSSFEWKKNIIEDGEYFLKIEDESDSKIIPVTLFSELKINGLSPVDGEVVTIKPGSKIQLSWNPLAVNSYKVIVKDNLGVEKNYITNSNQLAIDSLKGEKFSWIVLPEATKGIYPNNLDFNNITLSFSGIIQISGAPEKNILQINDDKINLYWNGQNGEEFLIKVIALKTNTDIYSEKTKIRNIDLPTKATGLYKLEIASLDYPGVQKAEYTYSVFSPILTWNQLLPKEIRSSESNEEVSLNFTPNLEFGDAGELLIKYQPLKGKMIEKKEVLKVSKKISLIGFGDYCFKGQLKVPVDFHTESKEYCFKLTEVPVFGPIKKPEDTVLKFTRQNNAEVYSLEVPPISKAVKYHFEIYSDNMANKLIFTFDSEKPILIWKTNLSGVYFLKYKVFDSKNRSSTFSPLSKLIFPISPLSDWGQ